MKTLLKILAIPGLILVMMAYSYYSTPAEVPVKDTPPAYPDVSRDLGELTNSVRATPLIWNDCMARGAAQRAKDIYESGVFDHVDINGNKTYDDYVEQCFHWKIVGENLTRGETPLGYSAQVAFDSLMSSPPHRKAILDENYVYLGIGCYDRYCVQLFAK